MCRCEWLRPGHSDQGGDWASLPAVVEAEELAEVWELEGVAGHLAFRSRAQTELGRYLLPELTL